LYKISKWYNFSKNRAKTAYHPEWAGINREFKEVCIKDPDAI
jgi:hypothetical protein